MHETPRTGMSLGTFGGSEGRARGVRSLTPLKTRRERDRSSTAHTILSRDAARSGARGPYAAEVYGIQYTYGIRCMRPLRRRAASRRLGAPAPSPNKTSSTERDPRLKTARCENTPHTGLTPCEAWHATRSTHRSPDTARPRGSPHRQPLNLRSSHTYTVGSHDSVDDREQCRKSEKEERGRSTRTPRARTTYATAC
jgi:hypothetical protein